MILSDQDILNGIAWGDIVITPFDRENLGSNSYDVHLSKYLACYYWTKASFSPTHGGYLDSKLHNKVDYYEIPEEGFIIMPGTLYLGSTLEYTESHKQVPFLEGKSSTGRLGISVHATAGKGDIGFCNHWTFEISCIHPVRIYAGMPIAQLIYFEANAVNRPYNTKKGAKYVEVSGLPVESMMWKNKF